MTPSSKTRLRKAAIFYSDVVGSSRMMRLSSRGTLDFMRVHDHVMEEQIRKFKGRVVDVAGDSFLAEFPKPALALSAALAVSRELESRVGPRKRIRIGLSYGQIEERDGKIFGEPVEQAKETESHAPSGAICASMEWADAVGLPDGSSLVSAGEKRFSKGIDPMDLVWIFPSPSTRERYEAEKVYLRRMTMLKRGTLFFWLLGLGLVTFSARHWINDQFDRNRWNLWMNESFDSVGGVYNRWDEKWDQHFVPAGGGSLRLGTSHMMYYRLPFKRQPFTVRVKLRAVEPGADAWAQLSVATTVWPTPKTGPEHDKWDALKWEGMFSALRLGGGTASLDVGYGVKGGENIIKDTLILDLPNSGKLNEWVLRFDKDVLSARLGLGESAQTLINKLPPSLNDPVFVFGLSGENIQIDSMRVESREALKLNAEQLKADSLYRSAFVGVDLAGAMLDGVLQKQGADSKRLAENAAQSLEAALNYPGGHPAGAKAQALRLRLLDGPLQQGDEALKLAREILSRRNSPFAQEALEIYMRRVGTADAAAKLEAQKFLEGTVAGARGRCGAAYGAMLNALAEIQKLRGDVGGYFKSVAVMVLDKDFTRFERDAVYRGLISGVSDLPFRNQLEAFADKIEKDRAAACRFYRDVLRTENANMLSPASDVGARSPLLARALRYFAMSLDFKKLEPAHKAVNEVWEYHPSLLRSQTYGAAEQKPLLLKAGGELAYAFDSGLDGVCGVKFRLEDDPSKAKDLRPYHGIELEIFVPKGVIWGLTLSESGDGPLGQGKFNGLRGADGEQYFLEQRRGVGSWEKVPFAFSEIRPQPYWGNQNGNNLLDTQAIDRVDLVLSSMQGKGLLLIRNIKFIP